MAQRIVFAAWGSLGDLHPYLAIALELQARGHRCVIATTDFHRAKVEAAGLEFASMGPHLDADPVVMKKSMHLRHGPKFLIRDLVMPYTGAAFAETMRAIAGADLLVTHPIAFGAHLAARKTGIRWASTALAPSGLFSVHDFSLRRQVSLFSKLSSGPWLDRAILKMARRETSRWATPFFELQAELGLPRAGDPLFEGQFSPQLNLALFSPLFGQPQPDWPTKTVITGFPFHDEPEALDARLGRFLDEGEAPVVFTLGSAASAVPRHFFHQSLLAVAKLKCRAVLIVGNYAPEQFEGSLPANVAAFPYAPYGELFSRGAVNVHHGGIGTTAQALRAGHPMLVVPFAFDQPDNAARAVDLGLARSVPIHHYTAPTAAKQLERLLHAPQCANRAADVGRRIREENGVAVAATELERLLRPS